MRPGHWRDIPQLLVERYNEGDVMSRHTTCTLEGDLRPRAGNEEAGGLGKVVPKLDGFKGFDL